MENEIWKAIISFIKENSSASPVLQGFQNRSRIEKNCAIVTFIEKSVQGTPTEKLDWDDEIRIVGSQVLARYQIDMYGSKSYNEISTVRTLLTDYVGIKHFEPYRCAPIMVTNIKNLTGSTIINGEYFKRYSIDLLISYRDNIEIKTEFINNINVITQEVTHNGIEY